MKRILPRNRVKEDFGLFELWKAFKKENKVLAKTLGQPKFRQIIEHANTLSREAVINNPHGFKLPSRLGQLIVLKKRIKRDPKYLPIDWKKTHELGYRVYHLNNHTDGLNYSIKWDRREAVVANKILHKFESCRLFSRQLAQAIIKDKKDFFLEKR